MKIFWPIILLATAALPSLATINGNLSQDKPSRVYVSSFTLTDELTCDDQYNATDENRLYMKAGVPKWADDSPGTAWANFTLIDTGEENFPQTNYFDYWGGDVKASWPAADSRNLVAETLVDYDIYSIPPQQTDGSGSFQLDNQSAPIFWEHCDYDVMLGGDLGSRTDRRSDQMTVHLQTGGKDLSNTRNLFNIWAGVSALLLPNDPYDAYLNLESDGSLNAYDYLFQTGNPNFNNPSPITVSIGGLGPTGFDDYLHVTLPDGRDLDITPLASGASPDYYQFFAYAQKAKVRILANNYPLAEDRVRPNANFCVGQQITFQALVDQLGATDTNIIWNFTADYINNHYTDPSSGCEIYNNSGLVSISNPTTAWFYNQKTQNATAELGVYCTFANGQTAYVVSQGQFNVFTPSITFTQLDTPVVDISSRHGLPFLGIGYPTASTYADATFFEGVVVSKTNFPGLGAATQLVNATGYLNEYPYPGDSTGGSFWLDNWVFEPDSQVKIEPTIDGKDTGTIIFKDAPAINVQAAITASDTAAFQTYFRFCPTNNGSIYVTLGLVNWGFSGSAYYNGSNLLSVSAWTIDSASTSGPSFVPSNQFPVWSNTFSNLGIY